jgi:hypothetical protein
MSYLLARYTQASGDYVEQLTYLLFLKMADELTKPPHPCNPIHSDSALTVQMFKRLKTSLAVTIQLSNNEPLYGN